MMHYCLLVFQSIIGTRVISRRVAPSTSKAVGASPLNQQSIIGTRVAPSTSKAVGASPLNQQSTMVLAHVSS
jgi:hypothetical protein